MTRTRPVVLIVDDDDLVRKALSRLVRSVGLEAEAFSSAEAMLKRGCDPIHECLILDLWMPAMNGLELQHRLAAMGCPIPVIVMSAHGDDQTRQAALRAGAVAFIQKPFDEAVLLTAVHAAISPADGAGGCADP